MTTLRTLLAPTALTLLLATACEPPPPPRRMRSTWARVVDAQSSTTGEGLRALTTLELVLA